jgi:hypothetical protein
MKRSLFLFLIVALAGTIAHASRENNSAFFLTVQRSIEQKEPNWRVAKSRIPKSGNVCFLEFASEKSAVGMLIFLQPSQEEAAAALAEIPNLLDLTASTNSLFQVGDESYLWQSKYNRNVGIDFRRGRAAVHVATDSLHLAKVFAQHISAAVSAAEQALGADSP